jgi:hypothetical protein
VKVCNAELGGIRRRFVAVVDLRLVMPVLMDLHRPRVDVRLEGVEAVA